MKNSQVKQYKSFKSFYPFYLSQHQNITCRRLHFIGSSLIIIMLAFILVNSAWLLLWTLPLLGYGFAWLGHFFFEKNRPATFTYPLYSLLGDWVMYKDTLTGKLKF
tara:strand:- start:1658 stop:1975 length:318 start_codon:yes stop_codon:yes gene_type:complete